MRKKFSFSFITVAILISIFGTVSGYNNYLKNSNFVSLDCNQPNFTSTNRQCHSFLTPQSWQAVLDTSLLDNDFEARFVPASSISRSATNQTIVTFNNHYGGLDVKNFLRQKIQTFPFGDYRLKVRGLVGHQSAFKPNQAYFTVMIFTFQPPNLPSDYLFHNKTKYFQTEGQFQFQFNFTSSRVYENFYIFLLDLSSYPGYSMGIRQATLERFGDTCQSSFTEVQLSDGSSICQQRSSISTTQLQCKVWSKEDPTICASHISYCSSEKKITQTATSTTYSCDSCYPPYSFEGTDHSKCVFSGQPSSIIPHCTLLKPNSYSLTLCSECQQGYVPSTDKTQCVVQGAPVNPPAPTSCPVTQQLVSLESNNQQTKSCLTQAQLINHCSVYQLTNNVYTCKTCNQGYSRVKVSEDSSTVFRCINSIMLVNDCDIYVRFLSTCVYKCQSCVAGKSVGNVKSGFRIVQKCLSQANEFLPDCNLYTEDNGAFYCSSGHCQASTVQIPIGTTSKQLACTSFATFNNKCQIYQRPIATDSDLKCSQCKDLSLSLPYCH